MVQQIFDESEPVEFEPEVDCLCVKRTECTRCRGATYEAKPCGGISDRHCIRK